MIFFITFLRALAACLITNSHYEGVYPSEVFANGGMLGDVLFFAVSGYCLYNVKYKLSPKGFILWYGRRIWRIYPPVIVISVLLMVMGIYDLEEYSVFYILIFPTAYHFVASIMILYVPFFFIMKFDKLRKNIPIIMILVAGACLALYFTVYDRSYYHIDTLREPMIRFLFMESMLFGAWLRQNDEKFRNKFKAVYIIGAIISAGAYVAVKVLLTNGDKYAPYQFCSFIAIFALLIFVMLTACGIDCKLEKLPPPFKKLIGFISALTLEIYIVQRYIITLITSMEHTFPLNWLILTASITLAAVVLHLVCKGLYICTDKLFAKAANRSEKTNNSS